MMSRAVALYYVPDKMWYDLCSRHMYLRDDLPCLNIPHFAALVSRGGQQLLSIRRPAQLYIVCKQKPVQKVFILQNQPPTLSIKWGGGGGWGGIVQKTANQAPSLELGSQGYGV